MKRFRNLFLAVAVCGAVALAPTPAGAAVINAVDIGGYTTFEDTNTGLIWLDLNNFFGLTYNEMATLATAAGFTLAVQADVMQLLNTLPLTGGEWSSYAAIMGSAPNRDLIWGAYGPVVDNIYGWAYSLNGDTNWTFSNTEFDADQVPNDGTAFADMNIWAFRTQASQVPEPSSILLFGAGLFGSMVARRRQRTGRRQ